ncbi:hypothetical protein DM780_00195 [Blattabacterium punctulatus]|nr:hypothetical protein DM780_00195 [Blattabacterium punctulatus]
MRTKLKNIMTDHILEINFSAKYKIKKK